LRVLAIAACYSDDYDGALQLIRQQQLIAEVPGLMARWGSTVMIGALTETGNLAAAERVCGQALAQSRDIGDMVDLSVLLMEMADLDMAASRFQGAAAHLREALQVAVRAGDGWDVSNGLWNCATLCAATGRYAEAATLWAAHAAHFRQLEFTGGPRDARRQEEALSQIQQALGPDRIRAAEDRGAAMSLDTATEYALMLTAPAASSAAGPGVGRLSARERELVTLIAQGRTNAQIAAQLYISVRTVGSHLDRIRDKTGCRRRTDLTRLALTEGLV
jgi:DNA-binding CsgD family transcriptional regulator